MHVPAMLNLLRHRCRLVQPAEPPGIDATSMGSCQNSHTNCCCLEAPNYPLYNSRSATGIHESNKKLQLRILAHCLLLQMHVKQMF